MSIRPIQYVLLLMPLMMVPSDVGATALKVCNDTNYRWRVTIDDRKPITVEVQGNCKCHVTGACPSALGKIHNSGWVDIATGVKDPGYSVVFDVEWSGRWRRAFVISMQGNYRTNIAQLVDDLQARTFSLSMWWEPNHMENGGAKCRDKPPLDACRGTSCLIPHQGEPAYRFAY